MTEAQAIEAISAQFATQWPTVSGSLPFALENEALPTSTSFAMLTVKHTTSAPITMGSTGTRKCQRAGWIFVKLWGPVDAGRKGLSTLADGVRGIFELQQLGGSPGVEPITIYSGLTQEVGVDGAHYMIVVQFPFRFYTTV